MGLGKSAFVLIVLAGIASVLINFFPTEVELPKIKKDGWYGRTKLKKGQAIPKDSPDIHKFTINVSDSVLEDLQKRLENARFLEPIEGTDFRYGFNSNYLKQVVDYWKTKYDWRKEEKELNKYEQFLTQIEGINVHFIRVKPSKPAKIVLPLMLVHGWPGSVLEYYKAISMLTEPVNDLAFEVICPSIPGYGFSEEPHQEGFDNIETARVFVKLMNRLGHKKFFLHGGDWGFLIVKTMGIYFPENVRGIHLPVAGVKLTGMALVKFVLGAFLPSLVFDDPVKDYQKIYPLGEKLYFSIREAGYLHIQATKPDTVGASLHDSPVGLAAYILEKFSTWTNPDNIYKPDGGLTEKFTLDELLTNVMIYWINNPVSSVRYYKENVYKIFYENRIFDATLPKVPVGLADVPHELLRVPKALAKYQFPNLIQYTEMPRGGHFSAFEEPKLIVTDIRKFVKLCLVNEELEASKQREKQQTK